MLNHVFIETDKLVWIDYHAPTAQDLADIQKEHQISHLILQDSIEVGHLPKYERGEKFEFLLVRYYSKSDSYYQNIVREFSNKYSHTF